MLLVLMFVLKGLADGFYLSPSVRIFDFQSLLIKNGFNYAFYISTLIKYAESRDQTFAASHLVSRLSILSTVLFSTNGFLTLVLGILMKKKIFGYFSISEFVFPCHLIKVL